MGEFSLTHWIVILVVVLIFFGPRRLPELGGSIGEAIKNFKKGISNAKELPPEEPTTTATTGTKTKSEDKVS